MSTPLDYLRLRQDRSYFQDIMQRIAAGALTSADFSRRDIQQLMKAQARWKESDAA